MNTITYYLLSVYHTKEQNEFFYFWRPDSKGYTSDLGQAGEYKTGEVGTFSPDHHNTMRVLPVDKESELFTKLEMEVSEACGIQVKNNDKNCRLLGITSDGRHLKRGL